MVSKTNFLFNLKSFHETFWKLSIVMMVMFHRSTLMGSGAGTSGGVAANPWLINESEETRGLTFGEIKQQQQQIIEGNYT